MTANLHSDPLARESGTPKDHALLSRCAMRASRKYHIGERYHAKHNILFARRIP